MTSTSDMLEIAVRFMILFRLFFWSECSPGVSTNAIWYCGSVQIPTTRCRVVCGRLEIMEIF